MNTFNNISSGVSRAASAASPVISAACKGTLLGAKAYATAADTTYLVASSALEIANSTRRGVTELFSHPKESLKYGASYLTGMTNFSEAKRTLFRTPNQYLGDINDPTIVKAKDVRTIMQRLGDSAAEATIGVAKLVANGTSAALYATNAGFRSAVNTTAGALGSVALEGSKYAVSGTTQALQAIGSASLEAAHELRKDPRTAIENVAHYTTIVAGAAGALGMAYLSAKALMRADAERVNGAGWGSRIKMGTYLLGSAATAVAAATLAAVSYQTYNDLGTCHNPTYT